MSILFIGKRGRPSVKLLKAEHRELKSIAIKAETLTKLASSFKMDRVSMTRIIKSGAGSPHNITKIRRKLSKRKTAA
jgi:indole-3-glycerol phosphate synthase